MEAVTSSQERNIDCISQWEECQSHNVERAWEWEIVLYYFGKIQSAHLSLCLRAAPRPQETSKCLRTDIPPIVFNQLLTGAGLQKLHLACLLVGASLRCDLHCLQHSSGDRAKELLGGLFSI